MSTDGTWHFSSFCLYFYSAPLAVGSSALLPHKKCCSTLHTSCCNSPDLTSSLTLRIPYTLYGHSYKDLLISTTLYDTPSLCYTLSFSLQIYYFALEANRTGQLTLLSTIHKVDIQIPLQPRNSQQVITDGGSGQCQQRPTIYLSAGPHNTVLTILC
jgi:hypothetical protein